VIAAPFDGIVTERRTDIGDLANAGSGEGQTLFRVADAQKLRVYVDVPQNYASAIGARIPATLTVPERPGESFVAQYLSTASAIDSASGAVTIELMCDNADGKLIPGAYTQVHLTLGSTASPTMRLPSSTLILGHQGEEVATVASNGQVTMKKVTIARDLGAEVEISAGISASDRVVDNPPDSLADGDTVRIASHAGSRLAAAKTAGGSHAQS
jgi:RND family efflux transporter MFP subunit